MPWDLPEVPGWDHPRHRVASHRHAADLRLDAARRIRRKVNTWRLQEEVGVFGAFRSLGRCLAYNLGDMLKGGIPSTIYLFSLI